MTRSSRILVILLATLAVGAQALAGARSWVVCLGECLDCQEPAPQKCCSHDPGEAPPEPGPCEHGDCPCVMVPLTGSTAKVNEAPPTHELTQTALLAPLVRIALPVAQHRPASLSPRDPPRPPPGLPLSTIVLLI